MSDPGWGRHCGDLWRDHVLDQTGRDVSDIVGAMPRRPREFAAMMHRLGVRDLGGVVTAAMGPAIPRRQAMRGDVVRQGWALGICRGPVAEFFGGETSPMRHVDQAWGVRHG